MDRGWQQDVPVWVEQTLATSGRWEVVSFLLTAHLLARSDYEAWRLGEYETLDAAMAGRDLQEVAAMVLSALQDVDARPLTATAHRWYGWGACEGRHLRLFADAELEQRCLYCWSPQQDRAQLDLFMDAPRLVLLNRLRQAMVERSAQCEVLFDRAAAEIGDDASVARLEMIYAAMAQREIADPLVWLAYLQQTIVPAIHDEFPHCAADLLAPLWRRSAESLAERPFDPAHPQHHCSALWLQAEAYDAALEAVAAVPQWWRYAALHLCRIAVFQAQHDQQQVRAAWSLFCWVQPDAAGSALESADLHASGLARLWTMAGQLELPVEDMPALLLLHDSLQALSDLEAMVAGDAALADVVGDGWQHYQMLRALLQSEATGACDVDARAALKAPAPALFRAFMATR